MSVPRVSEADRAHFRAIAEANGPLPEDAPPRSLAELFDRLEAMRRALGSLAQPEVAGEDPSELEAHRRVLRRGQELG